MHESELVVTTDPTPEQVQYLEDRIYEFNSSATDITDGNWLAIFVRDEHARIVAGICGNTWGGCLDAFGSCGMFGGYLSISILSI